MEIFDGRLTLDFAVFAPVEVDAKRGTTHDVLHKKGIAVAHTTEVFATAYIEPLMQATFNPPILANPS